MGTQVLDALRVPSDAYCVLAVTMCDLFPRPEWNFVYGLAKFTSRVGVFSFVRHTPGKAPEEWRSAQLLHRSMKTMLHEIGHMFGLKHCTWFNCLMRGSNGERVERQANYLHLCPVCLRKLHWNIGFDIPERYVKLLELYQAFEKHNEFFARDCAFLQQRLSALEDLSPGVTVLSAWTGRKLPAVTLRVAAVGKAAYRATSNAEPKCKPRAMRDQQRTEDVADHAERPRSRGSVGEGQALPQSNTTQLRTASEATKRAGNGTSVTERAYRQHRHELYS